MLPNEIYPLKHLSVRVPWHDQGWNGTICSNPANNTSCLKLRRIEELKDEELESRYAGMSIEELSQDLWPCCVAERGMFMAPFDYVKVVDHPYKESSKETHGHFKATPLRFPAYSAAVIPFRWMLKSSIDELKKYYPLDVDESREPNLPFSSNWWQEKTNQETLLNSFMNHIQVGSLIFFYAKQIPFVEETRRVLIGVARVKHIGELTEYQYTTTSPSLRAMLWERMVQHTLRPDFHDGFLLPYQELFTYAEKHPEINVAECIAFAPEERMAEFSYASEHVSNDSAIECLIELAKSLEKMKKYIRGPWDECMKWIDDRLSEIWKLRGPYPGLGACFTAMGVSLGTFVARALEQHFTENADIWPLVDAMFENPKDYLPSSLAKQVTPELSRMWKQMPSERKELVKLLSRMELSNEQAKVVFVQSERKKKGIHATDEEILKNPYILYEQTRLQLEPIPIWTIDKAMFPNETLLETCPFLREGSFDSKYDIRRVRALVVYVLEQAANNGDTLLPFEEIVRQIRNLPIVPDCELHEDLLTSIETDLQQEIIIVEMEDGSKAYQLKRLYEMGQLIREKVEKRLKGTRISISADWRALLDEKLGGPIQIADPYEAEKEEMARTEKAAILKELAESRISVLIGPAGTGKTTLLSTLISHPEIQQGDVLLLAPTGKARVRMEEVSKTLKIKAYTLAQFLGRTNRYDYQNFRYQLINAKGEKHAQTVIVDEASMLTEEMMAALFEALEGVQRFIFVGDPRQLPPIGAGRPFVDLVNYLTPDDVEFMFPKVGKGYGQLTIPRRQSSETGGERDDLRLAQWFSRNSVHPADDEYFDEANFPVSSSTLRFVQWNREEELLPTLKRVLMEELELENENDVNGFERSLGGVTTEKGYINFVSHSSGKNNSVHKVESWQILSPVKNALYGVKAINREIHATFKQERIHSSQKTFNRYFPKPMGPEQIVYGDKVINTINHKRTSVWPKEGAQGYVANGEIGLVIGEFRKNAKYFNVEFSSQPGYRYEYFTWDFSEEGEPTLELAYALTVHKSQGSEFGKVFVIIPESCALLSPELLYTALTRQKEKVIILHQGPRSNLWRYASDRYSETARRYTNLFEKPNMIEIDEGVFLEKRLIHRTTRGELVRSKSEVIIADLLHANGINYLYEEPLKLGGTIRYPDFTIEDDDLGITYYWEHCGMLSNLEYRKRWEAKLEWYRSHNILPIEEGGNLIVTMEAENGGIDSKKIQQLISSLFK
ncbi:ATP-dependent exoDNAse (exonuclease V) alpha subunit [Anoxybacillus vitaminiphilus]|uniref:ATP-dependent exoDNAse (Exonuclease V) alpha subunit n=1 Tax=Paranoxybacillus vitaminiphilus TaxID=581036 RepID=A0A327Y5E1_9BACL|nr:AAA family ATPase [Anoxybacillus vitaminiphilus]RAK15236.1 ATP-dependent exoDNAse (exonuclease V) alpha subunit [Anoxybacillus vitaminiphilus]